MTASLRARAQAWRLRRIAWRDRRRLAALVRAHPGIEIHPSASSNLAVARFAVAPGAKLRIGPGVATERNPGAVRFLIEPGATVEIGDGTWLRTELGSVVIAAFKGARVSIGEEVFLNGCHLSSKTSLTLGRLSMVGPGSRIFDADQHDLDADRPERSEPVTVGDHAWVAGGVTVLRGVTVGEHSVVGAHSLVVRDVPPHSLAFGVPAEVRGPVGDRTDCR